MATRCLFLCASEKNQTAFMKRLLTMALAAGLCYTAQSQTYTPLSGNALLFNGVAAMRLESANGNAALQPSGAITIEAWVNASCCQNTENAILSYGNGTNDTYTLSIGTYGPRLVLQDANNSFIDIRRTVKYEALNTNRDYHIAATWSNVSQSVVIYINGFKYYEQTNLPAFNLFYNNSNHLTIGNKTNLSQPYNGLLDEVRIWNTALSQSAIRSNMNSQLTGTESGLLAYYRFDESLTSTTAMPTGTGIPLNGLNIAAANKTASTANIPSKVPYYSDKIQRTAWDVQRTVATGITWKYKLYDTLFDNRQSINVLDIDLATADVDLRIANLPTNTNAALAKMKTSDLLKKYHAIAAINGSYYNTSSPYGAATFLREEGTTTATTNAAHGVGYPDEKAFVFNAGNTNVNVVNRPAANQQSPFVSGWNGFTGFENMMAGGPGLLTGGNVTYEYVPMDVSHEGASGSSSWRWHMSFYPFTAAGVTANNHLILVTGDGRTANVGGVAGLTVEQVAHLMKALGCTDALKLDGGGSTTMAIEGATHSDVVNYPSDNGIFDHEGERSNPNALLLVPRSRRGSGSALSFDGNDDRVIVPHSTFGNPTGSFSVEGWAKIDNGTNDDAIISKHDNNSGRKGFYIQYSYSSNKLGAGIGRSNNSWGAITASTPSWSANQWHHFAMTYNPTTDSLKLYVDGEPAGATLVPDPVFSTNNLCIGGSDFYPANSFKGGLDEIRFWSKELTATEIKRDMHRNVSVTATGLTAYYKFDEFLVSPVKDYSSNALTGTTNGGMNLHNLIASYAPIAGEKFDGLSALGANWWPYNSNSQTGTQIAVAFNAEPKYLLVAHNNLTGDTTAGIPAALTKRLKRSWLADKFGVVTESMNLSFTTNQLGVSQLDSNREYFLLFSADGNDYTPLSATGTLLSNNTLSFNGIAIREGWYTIGWKPLSFYHAPGNRAFEFNGAGNIVKVPYNKFGAPAADFSIELWAKIGAGGSGDDAIINANENVSGRKGYYIEYGYANSATPGLKAGIARSNGNWLTALYPAANWLPDQWHHVAMTYDATARTINLYEDGLLVSTANMGTDTAIFSTRPFGIGGSDAYTANGFKGAIDEVRVWHKMLSSTEISDSMHLQVSIHNPALKAYYKMDSLVNGYLRNETDTALNGIASNDMSNTNIITSYAPVDLQPINNFVTYKGNWSVRNNNINNGLHIESGFTTETGYILHKNNNQTGVDTTGPVADRQLNRVWHLSKKGLGVNPLALNFYADSLVNNMDSIQTVFLLHSADNITYNIADSITAGNIRDTLTFRLQDTINSYITLGFRKVKPALPPTGVIPQTGQAETLSVYPNPVSDFLFLNIESKQDQDAVLTVYNALGVPVTQRPQPLHHSSNNVMVNVRNMPAGSYILTVTLKDKVLRKVFVKQ